MSETTATERDARHLERAIELAGRARGQTSPEPAGRRGDRQGRARDRRGLPRQPPGEPHAERVALAACEEDPAGATMYVSLEPCCHEGRTPPCTDAILEAGIARVVIASDDPTPKAHGPGPGILRDEGIEVDVARRRAGRERPPPQPALPQARPDRPAARGLQVRDDARRQGGHPHRRLAVDLRRVEPRPRAPLARRGGRRGGGHRHGPRGRPAAHRPRRGRRPPAARAWCSTPRRSLPLDSQLVRERGRGAGDPGLLARRQPHGGAGARGGRRRGDRGQRRQRGGPRRRRARRARRARDPVAAARGRPAPGRRLPRGRRDRRGAHLRRADPARRPRGASGRRGHGRRADRRRPARVSRSRSSGSTTTC